jgi:hypothetical protein
MGQGWAFGGGVVGQATNNNEGDQQPKTSLLLVA